MVHTSRGVGRRVTRQTALGLVLALLAALALIAYLRVTLPGPRPTPHRGLRNGVDAYDRVVLADRPTAYWRLDGSAVDVSAHGHTGRYVGGLPKQSSLPNGGPVSDFDGQSQYVSVPSSPEFSISTTGQLTWEAWIQPDVLQFPANMKGYVDFLGKCEHYSPSCEWEGRMYNLQSRANRPSRLSAYVFNSTAGLGSGADWQPSSGQITTSQWLYVVAEYQTVTTPSLCSTRFPGTIRIWVDAVPADAVLHKPTGCMSQYRVTPTAGDSDLTIATMARDSFFAGSIGRVAIYEHLLSMDDIAAHYRAMTGEPPSGTCGKTCSLG